MDKKKADREVDIHSETLYEKIFEHLDKYQFDTQLFISRLQNWLNKNEKIRVGDIVYSRHLKDTFDNLYVVLGNGTLFKLSDKSTYPITRTFDSLHMEFFKSKKQKIIKEDLK